VSWKGWETWSPPTADGRTRARSSKAPRVRNYRTAWVHADTLVVTHKPQAGDRWIRFHSTREARRYVALRGLEQTGAISGLARQVPYDLRVPRPNGDTVVIGRYVADFVYRTPDGAIVIEDTKGYRTDLYRWKKRHVEAQYGVVIRET
jgi:hypothetical protein